jgi:hypothetical protein
VGDLEHLARRRRHGGDEAHGLPEERHLADVLARAEDRELALALRGPMGDAHGARAHDEERLAHHVLDEERAPGREGLGLGDLREDPDARLGEVLEQRGALEHLGRRHAALPSPPRYRAAYPT